MTDAIVIRNLLSCRYDTSALFRTRHATQPGSESPHHLVCSASARIGVVVRPDRTMKSHSPGRPLFDRVEQLDNAPMEGRNGELYAFDASHSRSRSLTQPKKDTTEDPQLWLGLLRRIPTSNTLPAGPLPESFSLFLTFCGRARRIASLFEEQPRCAEVDDPFVDFAIASDGATRFSVLGDPRGVALPDGRSVFSRSSRVVCRGLFAIVPF